MTENSAPDTTEERHELWDWLDDDAREALRAGGAPSEDQLDAATDRRRRADEAVADDHATVTRLPTGGGVLSIHQDQTYWTDTQIAALMAHCNISADVPKGEVFAFLHLCQRAQLDPFANEAYLIGRKERVNGQERTKYTVQTGIDGFRTIAERTGQYQGKEGPWWCGPDGQFTDVWLGDGPPAAARITIHRAGIGPLTATVLYKEFVPLKKVWEGTGNTRRPKRDESGAEVTEPMGMWPKMPAHMLAKCAEALAIRQAFPRQVGGIYVEEEMHQADARAAEEAEAERARQRRELVQRLPAGPGPDASPADTATGQVIAGEALPSREDMWAELVEQARLLATTIPAMTRRWVRAHKKNIEDATDAELAELIRSRRAEAAAALIAEAAAGTALPETGPSEGPQATGSPEAGQAAPPAPGGPEAAQEPAQPSPHRYGGDGGACTHTGCGLPIDHDVHEDRP